MATSVGTLTIEMAANIVRLQQDMEKASRTVQGGVAKIQKAAALATRALGAIGVGLSAAAFASFIRGAIDAADETRKLSQKTGVAVKDLAGLQLAFRQSGLEASKLQDGLARMSKKMAEGDAAFAAMGLSVKTADGSLKSTRDMLGEVADKFAGYRDGAEKTAMAMQLFGKSGADLIPVLNGGSAALAEYDRIALQLGLTLDEKTAASAERFNDTLDLVGQGMQGAARQTAAQLRPTLEKLAGNFLTTVTKGDRLTKMANTLSAALKLLCTAGVAVVEVFSTVGKVLAGVMAAIHAAYSGEIGQVDDIIGVMLKDIGTGWKDTVNQIADAWSDTGDASVSAAVTMIGAMENAAPVIDKTTDKVKKLNEEMAMDHAAGLFYRELEAKVEAEEKAAIEMSNFGKDLFYRSLEDKAAAEIKAQEDAAGALKKQQEDYAKSWQETASQVGQSLADALMEGGKSASEYIKGLFRAMVLKPILQVGVGSVLGMLGMGGTANAAGGAMGQAMGLADIIGGVKTAYSAITGGAAAWWQGMGEAITYNMTGPMESFGVAVQGAATALGAITTGAAGYLAQWQVGNMISGNYSALGSDPNNAMMAATAVLPFVGPLIGGAINRLFGNEPYKVKDFGLQGNITGSGADLKQFTYMKSKGGVFSSSKRKRVLADLDPELQLLLDQSLSAITVATSSYAEAIGLSADSVAGYSQSISLSLKGLDAEGQQKAIAEMLDTFATGMITTLFPTLADFAKIGETAQETLARLGESIGAVNGQFDLLGLRLFDTSLAGADLSSQLIDVFGGIQNLTAATSAYYESFYTESEKTATTTRQLEQAFAALNLGMPASRDGFRDLVESLDMTTNEGQLTFAALMGLAPAFASITQSADELAEAAVKAAEEVAAESARMAEEAAEEAARMADAVAEEMARAADEAARAAEEAAEALEAMAEAARQLAADQRALNISLASGGMRATGNGMLAGLYDMAVSHEQRLADERAKGVDVTLLAILQTREFYNELDRLASEAKAAFMAFAGDLSVRGLKAGGNGDAADLLSLKIAQAEELAVAVAKGYDVTALKTIQAQEYANALQDKITTAQEALAAAEGQYQSLITQQAQAAEAQVNAARSAVTSAEEAYQSALDRQFEAAQDAARRTAEAWRNLAESIEQTINGLFGGAASPLSTSQRAAEARRLFEADLASARGGNLDAAGRLAGRANDYADLARQTSGSASEYAAIFGQIVSGLNSAMGFASARSVGPASVDPVAAALEAVKVAKDNLAAAEETARLAEESFYLDAEQLRLAESAITTAQENLAAVMAADTTAQSQFTRLQSATDQSLVALQETLDTARNQYVLYTYGIGQAHADAYAIVSALMGLGSGFALPGFAAGTNYIPQDMPVMVHKGEAIIPAAYNPSADGSADEIRGLREELRAQSRAMVQLQQRMNKTFDRWDVDGLPETRVVA